MSTVTNVEMLKQGTFNLLLKTNTELLNELLLSLSVFVCLNGVPVC